MNIQITKVGKYLCINDTESDFSIMPDKFNKSSIDTLRKEGESREDTYFELIQNILNILSHNGIKKYALGYGDKQSLLMSTITKNYIIDKDDILIPQINIIEK